MNALLLLWLALGGILTALCGGRVIIPVAMWLAPVLLLHAARTNAGLLTLALIWLVLGVATAIGNRGTLPMEGLAAVFVSFGIALPLVLAIAADRFLGPRLPLTAATFVFPLAWVTIHFLNTRYASFGSWQSPAYTQFGSLPLMQLASVTGLSGITFLIGWFASAVNAAWDRGWSGEASRTALLPFTIVIVAVVALGALRVASQRPGKTIRVATISYSKDGFVPGEVTRFLTDDLRADEASTVRAKVTQLQRRFLDETRREARAGASLVVWPEVNLLVGKDDEPAFLSSARELARTEHVHLSMGLGTVEHGAKHPLQNKEILIDSTGQIVFVHHKTRLVPNWEAEKASAGTTPLPVAATALGRVAAAICFENDFPQLIRQSINGGADLLLAPSNDWSEIRDVHLAMATFRAVENGVSMVRATSSGYSAAIDRVGRMYALGDDTAPNGRIMVAQLPIGGAPTIYARIGDLFGWLCGGTFAALVLAVLVRHARG